MDDLIDRLRRARSGLEPQEPAFERLVDRKNRKRRNGRITSAVVAFAVMGAAASGAVWAFGGRAASHQGVAGGDVTMPQFVAKPGQYYYWKTVLPVPGPDVIEEMWWGEDGSGRFQVDQSNSNYGGLNGMTWTNQDDFPGVRPFETDLSGLSTDPDVLAGQLRDRTSEGGASPEPEVTIGPSIGPENSSLWRSITNLLEMGNATPSLRQAIFAVAADTAGVTKETGVTDPAGRPAITLSVQLGDYYCGGDSVLYFDPDTHLLLASTGDLGCQPSLVVVGGGIVNKIGNTPDPSERFIPPPKS